MSREEVNEIDEDYLALVYKFANAYTEDGIRNWNREYEKAEKETVDIQQWLDLGYSWRDIAEMEE